MNSFDSHYFFDFNDIDLEICRRKNSTIIPAETQVQVLWNRLESLNFSTHYITKLRNLWDDLVSVNFNIVYDNYLLHPLRVAYSQTLYPSTSTVDNIATALCHNFRELSFEQGLSTPLQSIEEKHLSQQVSVCLDLLLTDRSQERHSDYLNSYYSSIQAHAQSLLTLKAFDKLDNHLTYAFESIDSYHHDTVRVFLIPILRKSQPHLADYLTRLVNYVEKPSTVEHYKLIEPQLSLNSLP